MNCLKSEPTCLLFGDESMYHLLPKIYKISMERLEIYTSLIRLFMKLVRTVPLERLVKVKIQTIK